MENPFWIIIFSFLMAGIPVLASLGTAYIKVHIVLGMLRNGLGTQNIPGALIIAALSIMITCMVMAPVFVETIRLVDKADFKDVTDPILLVKNPQMADILVPWKRFMFTHAGSRELQVFESLQHVGTDSSRAEEFSARPDFESSTYAVVVPAFVVSELKEAFAMAFALLLPFLVIDMVVSTVLAGLGMFMVSPVLISLPLKLLLFVFADGWLLIVHGLVRSYQLGG